MAIPFDTHAAIQRFITSGLTAPQAEALSATLQEIYSEHAVTRADFDLAMSRIDARFERLEATMNQKFTRVDAALETLRGDLHRETHTLKWGVGVSLPVLCSIAVKLWFF